MSTSSEESAPQSVPATREGRRTITIESRVRKPRELVSYTHFEEVLARINPFGAYQIFACICIFCVTIEWAGNYFFVSVLGSLEPAWSCKTQSGAYVNITPPTDDEKCAFIKANCTELTAIKSSSEFYSLVAAWKLICDDSDKPTLIQIIQAGGSFIGSVVGGHMGDHFGRMTFFFTGQLCVLITSVMATAAEKWYTYAISQFINGIFYGMIEVTSLTVMMEYTSNKYRLIPNACFQWPLAYMVISLIAFLTADWQYFFIFLNLVTSPFAIAFILFLESPRWLVASDQLEKACEVLNDVAHARWNNANIKFTANDLNLIPRDHRKQRPLFYNFYHLFCTKRLFKQSLMQILSMFTFALVSTSYIYTVSGMHESAIMFTFLDGVFRIIVPLLVIFLDFKFFKFGRKLQFIGSLTVIALCFAAVIALVCVGYKYDHIAITVLVIVATMVNDSAFWMNIVQITTQRYPTVIRCIAFGCIHAVKHVGVIVGLIALEPFLDTDPKWAFIIPEIFIVVTLISGLFLQPETKGKALMDRLVEGHFGRFENEIPKALMRLAAGHRFNQVAVRERLREQYKQQEMEAAQRGYDNAGAEFEQNSVMKTPN